MTDQTPSLSHGDEYVAIFTGGPNDGQTDTRVSTDGSWSKEVTVLTLVSGKETMETYTASTATQVADSVHVTYVYDAEDSEQGEEQGALGINN